MPTFLSLFQLSMRALSSLRGLRGAPEVPPLCRETQSLGQHMLNAPFGINGLMPMLDGTGTDAQWTDL